MPSTDMDGGVQDRLLTENGLSFPRLMKDPADGVEQKIGFLGQGPRLQSANSLRDISRKGALIEFSALDGPNAGGSFLFLEGLL